MRREGTTASGAGSVLGCAGNRGRESLKFALTISTALISVTILQEPALSETRPAAEPASARAALDIPPQPLSQALVRFANATGVQVFVNANLVRGINSRGVRGVLAPSAALGRLLSGTGLTYRFTNPTTVTLSSSSASLTLQPDAQGDMGGVILPTIDVTGGWQNLYTPNYGFVEKQTATGTKTDTPLIEVPQSVSVVTRGQLDARNVQTDSEALLYTPGVFAQPFGANVDQFNPYFYIRGFPTAFGGSYVDYLVSPVNYRYEPYGFVRYDILRGPTSVLYGQSDPGGLINRTTRRPLAVPANELLFQAGNYNWKQIAGNTTGPVDPDGNLLYGFTFLYRNASVAVDYDIGPPIPDNRLYLAPAITWNISPQTSMTLLGSVLADDAGAPGFYVTPNHVVTRTRLDRPGWDDFNFKQHFIGYVFEHQFDDTLSFRQRFRYANMDYDYNTLALADINFQPEDGITYIYPYGFSETRNDIVLDNNLQKLVVTGPMLHAILFGFDYQHFRDRVLFKSNFDNLIPFDIFNPEYSYIYPTPALNVDQDTTAISNNFGLYLQDQITIYERFVLTIGGRFDWARSKVSGFSRAFDPDYGLEYGEPVNEEANDTAFSWRAGLTYLAEDGLAPYFSYAKSFLPTPGFNTLTDQPFNPTTGEQYEVGIKYQPPGTQSLFTFAAYDLTKQNVLNNGQLPGGVFFQSQTGEINVRGLEFEATSDLTDDIKLLAAYTFTVGKITKSTNGSAGQTPALVPRNMASLWLDYELPNETFFAGLSFGGGVRYIGSTYAWETDNIFFPDEASRLKNSAYTLFDAAVRYDLGHVFRELKGTQLAVNATNIFNHGYQVCYSRFDCRLGVPLTVIGTVRYRW